MGKIDCGAMPTWTPHGGASWFPDTLMPGYTGYVPQDRRNPGSKGAHATLDISCGPYMGEFMKKAGLTQKRRRKRPERKQEDAPPPIPVPVKPKLEDDPVMASFIAKAKAQHDIMLVSRSLDGPRPQTPLADTEAKMNAFVYGPHYALPAGVFPAMETRYPPTHRSIGRMRNSGTPDRNAKRDLEYEANRTQVAKTLAATAARRMAMTEAPPSTSGSGRSHSSLSAKERNRSRKPKETQAVNYEDLAQFPIKKPHSLLMMTMYPPSDPNGRKQP